MQRYLSERPWIWIVVGFGALVLSLVMMIYISAINQPKEVKIEHASRYGDH